MYEVSLTGALLFCSSKETEISLAWSATTMPEYQPLQKLALLAFVLESEMIVFVKLQQIKKFC